MYFQVTLKQQNESSWRRIDAFCVGVRPKDSLFPVINFLNLMKLYFVALNGPISDSGRGHVQPTVCICMRNNKRLGMQKQSAPFSFEFNTLTTQCMFVKLTF